MGVWGRLLGLSWDLLGERRLAGSSGLRAGGLVGAACSSSFLAPGVGWCGAVADQYVEGLGREVVSLGERLEELARDLSQAVSRIVQLEQSRRGRVVAVASLPPLSIEEPSASLVSVPDVSAVR